MAYLPQIQPEEEDKTGFLEPEEQSELPELTEIKFNKKDLKQNQEEKGTKDGEIGPGEYNPEIDFTRKKPPTCSWSIYKTTRGAMMQKQHLQNPGPEKYNQQQTSIGMKMMRGILKQENVLDDSTKIQNYNKLVQKLSNKAKNEQEYKKEKHILKKKFQLSKVQPGAHQDLIALSDFQP